MYVWRDLRHLHAHTPRIPSTSNEFHQHQYLTIWLVYRQYQENKDTAFNIDSDACIITKIKAYKMHFNLVQYRNQQTNNSSTCGYPFP